MVRVHSYNPGAHTGLHIPICSSCMPAVMCHAEMNVATASASAARYSTTEVQNHSQYEATTIHQMFPLSGPFFLTSHQLGHVSPKASQGETIGAAEAESFYRPMPKLSRSQNCQITCRSSPPISQPPTHIPHWDEAMYLLPQHGLHSELAHFGRYTWHNKSNTGLPVLTFSGGQNVQISGHFPQNLQLLAPVIIT